MVISIACLLHRIEWWISLNWLDLMNISNTTDKAEGETYISSNIYVLVNG